MSSLAALCHIGSFPELVYLSQLDVTHHEIDPQCLQALTLPVT